VHGSTDRDAGPNTLIEAIDLPAVMPERGEPDDPILEDQDRHDTADALVISKLQSALRTAAPPRPQSGADSQANNSR
jgi:hypothetical protein